MSGGPLVGVNCGASPASFPSQLPPQLLVQLQLFGAEFLSQFLVQLQLFGAERCFDLEQLLGLSRAHQTRDQLTGGRTQATVAAR